MSLAEIPLIFALIGLMLYTVLAGADFGAGLWQLTAGSGPEARRLSDHAHHAIAPVWEANHVWLIFVITVVWTAYPVAFGSIASTLTVPLFIAALGIILRGAAYALHAGTSGARERRAIETVFSLSSVLTPFVLGTVVGGIASRRVPVGNAAGSLVSSWLNPTSIFLGVLAVAVARSLLRPTWPRTRSGWPTLTWSAGSGCAPSALGSPPAPSRSAAWSLCTRTPRRSTKAWSAVPGLLG